MNRRPSVATAKKHINTKPNKGKTQASAEDAAEEEEEELDSGVVVATVCVD